MRMRLAWNEQIACVSEIECSIVEFVMLTALRFVLELVVLLHFLFAWMNHFLSLFVWVCSASWSEVLYLTTHGSIAVLR